MWGCHYRHSRRARQSAAALQEATRAQVAVDLKSTVQVSRSPSARAEPNQCSEGQVERPGPEAVEGYRGSKVGWQWSPTPVESITSTVRVASKKKQN
ncbi:unnamed protein product [Lota lota]